MHWGNSCQSWRLPRRRPEPTTARFFGGASADDGETFGSSFDFNTPLDISGSIQIEESHINTVGNLYIVVLLGKDYLYRDSEGNYQAWDLELSTLQAASPDKTLSSFEPLTVVDDVPLGLQALQALP